MQTTIEQMNSTVAVEAGRVSLAAVLEMGQASRLPVIIDVRTPAEFASTHISGAINISLDRIQQGKLADALQQQGCSGQEPLYLLCQTGKRSAMALEAAQGQVSQPLLLVTDGMASCPPEWLEQQSGGVISLERQVRIAAGSLVLLGILGAVMFHPAWLAVSAFVGAGLTFAGITDTCGMGLLLAKMPWNKAR